VRDLTAPRAGVLLAAILAWSASRSPSRSLPATLHRRRPFDLEQKVRVEQPLDHDQGAAGSSP